MPSYQSHSQIVLYNESPDLILDAAKNSRLCLADRILCQAELGGDLGGASVFDGNLPERHPGLFLELNSHLVERSAVKRGHRRIIFVIIRIVNDVRHRQQPTQRLTSSFAPIRTSSKGIQNFVPGDTVYPAAKTRPRPIPFITWQPRRHTREHLLPHIPEIIFRHPRSATPVINQGRIKL